MKKLEIQVVIYIYIYIYIYMIMLTRSSERTFNPSRHTGIITAKTIHDNNISKYYNGF